MVEPITYRYEAGEFVPDSRHDDTVDGVLVADSWAVRDGQTVGIELHFDRFRTGLAAHGVAADAQGFISDVLDRLPRTGQWFPRIEAVRCGEDVLFRYWERVAPAREHDVVVTQASADPRTQPTIKGPDLIALGGLRTEAEHRGATEAIIVDPRGAIIEGAYSSLWWWKNDRIFRPTSSLSRIDSVTDRVLREHARRIGATVTDVEASPVELEGCELWVLSAAHGIRVATEWVDGPQLTALEGRASYWRTCYDNLAKPINRVTQ